MNRLKTFVSGLALTMVPVAAFCGFAAPPNRVPEPEALALIAIGVVALVIAKTRKRK